MACNNRHGEWNQSRYHKHPDLVIECQTGSIIFRDPQLHSDVRDQPDCRPPKECVD